MYPARCPSPSCRHAFTSERSGSVNCPACGTAAVIVLDVAATADTAPAIPPRRDDLPATVDVPPVQAGAASTIDGPSATDTAPFPTPALPATMGRFRVRAKLGSGAFGDVYRAHDPQLDREVALKVAKPGTLDSPERVGRFLREARAAANLRHPHIVPVFDSGRDGDRHYIASGFIDGRTLEAEIEASEGKLPDLRRAAVVVRKLAEALGYAHMQGVVHRDVKPANVLVDATGEPSLTDFGLAVRAGDEAVKTQDGKVMGTPAYMSPEQAAGKSAEATPASDQYALGIMLYEMATGRRPFEGPMEVVLIQQIQVEPHRPRSESRAIPKDLETVILKCLEKDVAKRYATCEALAEDLRRFLDGEPVMARRIGPAERFGRWAKRNPAVASSVSFGVLALLLGTVVALAQADVAKGEAKRALQAEGEERTRAGELGLALRDKTKAEEDVSKKAIDLGIALRDKTKAEGEVSKKATDLAVQLKEMVRVLDLSKLREAQAAFDSNLVQIARNTLAEISPENGCLCRGILHHRFEGGLFTLSGHTGPVWSVALSSDGSRIVTGSFDKTARVWDARTGQLLLELKGHKAEVYGTAVSADGSRIVTGSLDNTARVWDGRTGQLLLELKGHTQSVHGVTLSADGSRAVTGSSDKTARVWDARTGQALFKLRGDTGAVSSLAVSADGSRVVTSAGDNPVRLWDGRTGRVFLEFKSDMGEVSGVAVSADGSRVVTGSLDNTARVRDAKTGRLLLELNKHTGEITSVAVSADGSRIITGSLDNTARVWDGLTGQPLLELKGHVGSVLSVAISANGSRIVTGSGDNTARLWDARTGRFLLELKRHTNSVRSVALSGDGSRVVTASGDNTVRVWDTRSTVERAVGAADKARHLDTAGDETGTASFELKGHTGELFGVAVSVDGSRIVTASGDNTARIWDGQTGQSLVELRGHESEVRSVALAADGSRIVTGDESGTTLVWDAVPPIRTPSEKPASAGDSGNRTIGGGLPFVLGADLVLKLVTWSADERLRRGWLTRPDPDWHRQRQVELAAEGNAYGVALHRSFEQHAHGVLAFEAGDFDLAQAHFIVAAALKPAPPKVLDVALPPRPVNR